MGEWGGFLYAIALENERRRLRRFGAHRKDTSIAHAIRAWRNIFLGEVASLAPAFGTDSQGLVCSSFGQLILRLS
jgi:hypothetical protein